MRSASKGREVLLAMWICWTSSIAACAAEPDDAWRQAQLAAARGDSAAAVDFATHALKQDAELADAYHLRGREFFRLGEFAKSVADFDRYVALRPELASRQWERGISLYYNRQYKEGAEQFALYQTYHAADVENAVWRFLCMVPLVGIQQARQEMLPIEGDSRAGMMAIYDLYRGRLDPQQLLEAEPVDSSAPRNSAQRFYTSLYVGLYHHALGQADEAIDHLRQASRAEYRENPLVNRYMWDVARVHCRTQTGPAEAPPAAEDIPPRNGRE